MSGSLLITGGSGYLGHGLVAYLLTRGTFSRICIYSRDEAKQARMRRAFSDDPRLRFFLGDVRDRDRLRIAMTSVTHVIHAAALKRVDALEYNVMEGVATNVLGSENVVRAAIDAGVRRAVLVSSDKACEPTTVYGRTKAMAEDIFRTGHSYAGASGPSFGVVRYGNVAGSTESVIPTWRDCVKRGVQCELRDPHATRFWMTRQEAVEFVMRILLGRGDPWHGHVDFAAPDLPAYELLDLARAMDLSGWVTTHLKDGEKRHESMLPGCPSSEARRMTVDELREGLKSV